MRYRVAAAFLASAVAFESAAGVAGASLATASVGDSGASAGGVGDSGAVGGVGDSGAAGGVGVRGAGVGDSGAAGGVGVRWPAGGVGASPSMRARLWTSTCAAGAAASKLKLALHSRTSSSIAVCTFSRYLKCAAVRKKAWGCAAASSSAPLSTGGAVPKASLIGGHRCDAVARAGEVAATPLGNPPDGRRHPSTFCWGLFPRANASWEGPPRLPRPPSSGYLVRLHRAAAAAA